MASLVHAALTERFGLKGLRGVQRQIIDRMMEGGNALAVMPTGSGKSLCFQLPAVASPEPGVGLVFSPLIALMEDQVAALKQREIKAEYINSTVSGRERDRRHKRLADGEYELIYATPERMQKPAFIEALKAVPGGVKLLAVDEAHCIARWGHDLRPAYREIGAFRKMLGNPPTIALTATATPRVRDEIRRTLRLDAEAMPLFWTPIDRPNLSLEVAHVWHDDDKIEHISEVANPRGRMGGTGIVYFARIKDLTHFAGLLREAMPERQIEIYHGQLTVREKKRVYQEFIEAEPEDGLMLLATNAFGMGVDKPDIRFIIHAQMPGSVEAYFQEVGRAGRDGRKSRCRMLYGLDDLAIQQQFVEWMNPQADLIVRVANAMEASEHVDVDLDELQVMVGGKARNVPRGVLEHTVIGLVHAGVLESTSNAGRYGFNRPLRDDEVAATALQRKKRRDLHRLHDVVRLAKCDDVAEFIRWYFNLDDTLKRPKRASKSRSRGRKRPTRKKTSKQGRRTRPQAAESGSDSPKRRRRRGRGRKKRTTPATTAVAAETTSTVAAPDGSNTNGSTSTGRKRRRRRRRSRGGGTNGAATAVNGTQVTQGPPPETQGEGAAPAKKRRRRRRRRRRSSNAEAAAQPTSG